MTTWNAIPAYGPQGMPVPPHKNNEGVMPSPGPGHQWACIATYLVSQSQAEAAAQTWMNGQPPLGIELDHENLANVAGPGCLKCGRAMTPESYATSCPVHVIPLFARR